MMSLILINSMGLTAFLYSALVIYNVQGQIEQSIKGKDENVKSSILVRKYSEFQTQSSSLIYFLRLCQISKILIMEVNKKYLMNKSL